ncbi:MAG: transcription antitermination factor NusB [Chthoniobacter sp.]
MGKRREGREAAVQYLFQIDLNGEKQAGNAETFWALRSGPGKAPVTPKTRAFTELLVHGVMSHLDEIDGWIKKFAANYELSRLAAVDRNILRVATYELIHSLDVAPVVIINEAIEVAKKFGTDKSGGFVNGILDRIKQEVGRPAREPVAPTNP